MRLLGFIDEDPFDVSTWSGSSRFLFSALKDAGILSAAHGTEPSTLSRLWSQLECIHPRKATWRFQYHLSLSHYRRRTEIMRRYVESTSESTFDGLLQIGAWYDGAAVRDSICPDKFVASYHDGNLSALVNSPFGYPPISKRVIERTLAYEQDLYNRIDLIFPMSDWLARSFIEQNGVSPDHVVPVGAGINLPYVGDTMQRNYDRQEVLFVGKQFERKGGPDLLAAFERVRSALPDARLVIIGPELPHTPPGVECLGSLSKADPIQLTRLIQAYCEASVFVMPSLYEPFGIVLAEAMAHRLPCVGTAICAIPEIITDGDTGYIVPAGDPDALSERLIALLSDPSLCRQFGEAGYLRYQNQFTWDAVVEKMNRELTKRFNG